MKSETLEWAAPGSPFCWTLSGLPGWVSDRTFHVTALTGDRRGAGPFFTARAAIFSSIPYGVVALCAIGDCFSRRSLPCWKGYSLRAMGLAAGLDESGVGHCFPGSPASAPKGVCSVQMMVGSVPVMKTSFRTLGQDGPANSPLSVQICAETTPDGMRKSCAEW